ncbi:hypothetical protein Patl1_35403 [Pistacia atlantica]|nr:hypothetical protein Patl1_35403 [Pistacia atlantica]
MHVAHIPSSPPTSLLTTPKSNNLQWKSLRTLAGEFDGCLGCTSFLCWVNIMCSLEVFVCCGYGLRVHWLSESHRAITGLVRTRRWWRLRRRRWVERQKMKRQRRRGLLQL